MLSKKYFAAAIILIISISFFYLLNKSKSKTNSRDPIYTNEKVTEAKKELTAGFPALPIYPGILLDSSYKREQEGKTDFSSFWIYQGDESKAIEIMKWYVDELKKEGWKVAGPFMDEGEYELFITAENPIYNLRIYNSESEPDDVGPKGKLLVFDLKEK